MVKTGISGGMLSVLSFLDKNEREAATQNAMIKTSSNIKEAAKIGLQSLYANVDDILEKYKEFDLIKQMKTRKDANLLWVRARAIDADVVNTNGDYFSEEELTKEMDYQGKKMPAYKSFEGVPIYTNHQNDKIEEAKGMVVYSEWDDEEKCVYCVFFVDEDAYPEIARGIRLNYLKDVSMGCSVELGVCSICGHEATLEKDYCDCLKNYKGRQHPSGKKAFEYNYGIKFIELSCVGDGAFESCSIEEIYDQDEILDQAKDAVKTAQSLNASIHLAASLNNDISSRREIETALRQLYSLNNDFIRLAQTAGTLVGGQILGNGTANNATVVKILQALGIDPSGNLNILDLVNLSLNFLEVAVLHLFSRKDNIDLGHVAKLTKAMGELQNTLQDMIDDGIETGTRSQAPMIPPQNGVPPINPQQPNQIPQQPQPVQQTLFEPSVGRVVSPFSQTPYVMPLGGGVSAENTNYRFVWASNKEDIQINKLPINKLGKFIISINNLREICGIPEKNNNEVKENIIQKNKTVSGGDKKIMDYFNKIAQDVKKQNALATSFDIKFDDQHGNKIVLSTDQGIKGYHNGQLTNWKPVLSELQITQMENGDGYKVAGDLLKDFSNLIKTAESKNEVDKLMVWEDNLKQDWDPVEDSIIHRVKELHKGQDYKPWCNKLEVRRKNKNSDVLTTPKEEALEVDREGSPYQIIKELAEHAHKGIGSTPLEDLLHPEMQHSYIAGKKIMGNVLQSIAKTCIATKTKPEAVINYLTSLASKNDFPVLLKLARLGTSVRKYNNLMKYAQEDKLQINPEVGENEKDLSMQSMTNLADNSLPESTEGDLIDALNVIKDNFSQAVEKLNEILEKLSPEKNKLDDMKDGLVEHDEETDDDAMKGAVSGLSLSGDETGATPSQLVNTVDSMPTNELEDGIDNARKPEFSTARSQFRNTRQASNQSLKDNIIGWLADVANYNQISTQKIALAAKMFCSYKEAAKNILSKSLKTAEIKVTDETLHSTTIWATLDDIGVDVKDAAFNEKFRDFAVVLLGKSGYEVDHTTFALTEINVDESGMVCGKVVSKALKTFSPDDVMEDKYIDEDRASKEAIQPPIEGIPNTVDIRYEDQPQIMSESAKSAKRLSRIKNVIKVAQGLGLPGAPPPGSPIAAPATPAGEAATQPPGMAGGAADLGLSSLTGTTAPMDSTINESPEPGNKAPWGTICPQCGSKDVDIANGEGNCNSCNAQLKFKFIVEANPPDEKIMNNEGVNGLQTPEAPLPPVGGPLSPEAGGVTQPGGVAQQPGLPTASSRVMTRISYKTTADVYVNALSNDFDKDASLKLPVGLICPSCGSRTASKQNNHTYCYDCGTLSISKIKRDKKHAGTINAEIVWL